MRRFRFFTERLKLRVGSSVKLPDFEAKHARKALRLKKGHEVYLFNGEKEYKAKLTLVTNDTLMAKIEEEFDVKINNNKITLYQALPKIKNFELILEKCTETGVDKFVPITSEYSVVDTKKIDRKLERWEKIIINSVKQSERVSIPEIVEPIDFESAIKQDNDIKLFLTLEKEIENSFDIKNIIDIDLKSKSVSIFIGPEGGFSPGEHKLAKENKCIFVHISPNVLRSETAAIFATGIVKLKITK